MDVLKSHDWPGNIRELQNFIERAVVLSPESVLRPRSELKQMTKQNAASVSRTLAEAEREHIMDVLKQTDGQIGGMHGAAARLGLPRTTLVYKMRKLGIEARRSLRARPSRQLADEPCHAAANCWRRALGLRARCWLLELSESAMVLRWFKATIGYQAMQLRGAEDA